MSEVRPNCPPIKPQELRALGLQALRDDLSLANERLHRLEQSAKRLRQMLDGIAEGCQVAKKSATWARDQYLDDILSKLTVEEVWTLEVLCDFLGATVGRLEELLGFSGSSYVLHQLAPLERFGLATSRDQFWQPTATGFAVIDWRKRKYSEPSSH